MMVQRSVVLNCQQIRGLLRCYFVPAVSDNEPSRPDHLPRMVQPAKRVIAARIDKAIVAGDQIPVQLCLA
jgi:hypothetical protein